jgi:hypothetical protein
MNSPYFKEVEFAKFVKKFKYIPAPVSKCCNQNLIIVRPP